MLVRRLALAMCGTTAALLAAAALATQEDPSLERLEKSPRHHEWVQVETAAGRTVRAFLVFPEVDRPADSVVVIHENRGLTDWVRSVADQLAEMGYLAIAPDLLSQMGPDKGGTESFTDGDAARAALYELSDEQILADLDATVAFVRKHAASTERVSVAGFCWGGSQTFRYATHQPQIAAAFVFYGSAPADAAELGRITAPVYGFFGGNDFRITSQVPAVTEAMEEAGKRFEPVVYPEAGHGFVRTGELSNAREADRRAATAAWERWKAILAAGE